MSPMVAGATEHEAYLADFESAQRQRAGESERLRGPQKFRWGLAPTSVAIEGMLRDVRRDGWCHQSVERLAARGAAPYLGGRDVWRLGFEEDDARRCRGQR